ncbi:MAG: hypothetical protein WBK77_01705 [Alphaproteobacteria bacterium]
MKKPYQYALIACVLTLGACNTVDGLVEDVKFNDWFANSGRAASGSESLLADGCPQTEIVAELGTLNEFTDNAKPGSKNLVSNAHIAKVDAKCAFSSQSVTLDLKLTIDGTLGPAGHKNAKPSFTYPYFVAVTSPIGTILAKEVFTASLAYDAGMDNQTYTETMRQIIPIPNKDAAAKYKVLIGFQLTPEQLAYNRAVEAAEKAAAIEREKIQKANIAAAKKGAKQEAPSEAIIVPDTITSGAPVNIAPTAK